MLQRTLGTGLFLLAGLVILPGLPAATITVDWAYITFGLNECVSGGGYDLGTPASGQIHVNEKVVVRLTKGSTIIESTNSG